VDTPRDLWNTTWKASTVMALTDTERDEEQTLSNLEDILEDKLRQIVEADPKMEHVDVTIGFTKNSRSTTTDSVVRGDFHLIGSSNFKGIVVYSLAKYVHFGFLFDETSYIIQPLDVSELREVLLAWPLHEQYYHAKLVIKNLDRLLGK
jgi:hypothetical protein